MPGARIGGPGGFLGSWFPLFPWAWGTFFFSTDIFWSANTAGAFDPILKQMFPQLTADHIERLHAVFRKLGHLTEYFVFGGLLWRALRSHAAIGTRSRRLAVSIAVTAIYAASDEWHESFV